MSTTCTKDYVLTVNHALTVSAYWTLEETGSTSDRVDSANGIHLTPLFPLQTGETNGTGIIGNGLACLQMDGSSGFNISGPFIPQLATAGVNGWSVFGWFKVVTWATTSWSVYPNLEYDGDNNIEAQLQINPDGPNAAQFFIRDNNGNDYSPADFNPTLGTWYFFHIFFDPVQVKVGYSINNGSAVYASGPAPSFIATTSGAFGFGSWWGSANTALTGVIFDEVGLKLDRKLTAAEQTFLYNSGSGRTWPI